MKTVDLAFNFTKPQREVFKDNSKIKLLRAGRGFGKSFLIRKSAVLDCITWGMKPEHRNWPYKIPTVHILGRHSTVVQQIHWNELVKECTTIYSDLVADIKTIERRIIWIGNRPDLILAGLDKGAVGDNLRGRSFYKTYVDEAQEVDLINLLDEIIQPRMEVPGSSFTAIFTPKGFTNPTYLLAERIKQDGTGREFHFTSYDSAIKRQEELDTLRKTLPAKKFSQEILAEYVSFDSQIFTEFSLEKNVIEERRDYAAYYIGVDNGAINPAVVVLGVYIEDDLYKLDIIDYWRNLTGESVTTDEVLDVIGKFVRRYPPTKIYIPDDRPDIEKQAQGCFPAISIQQTKRNEPSPLERAEHMNRLFKMGSLRLLKRDDQHYKAFLSEIMSYARQQTSGIILDGIAPNQEDHLIDATAYAVGQLLLNHSIEFYGTNSTYGET